MRAAAAAAQNALETEALHQFQMRVQAARAAARNASARNTSESAVQPVQPIKPV